jgi:hypothetical protein
MVNPPFNPLVVGLPEGHPGPLTPELNFRIGTALAYSEHFRAVYYQTDIETLEGGP